MATEYLVRLYLEVRHDIHGVTAESPEEALKKAVKGNDLYALARGGGEYAENICGAIVDVYNSHGKLVRSCDIENLDAVLDGSI